MKVIDRIRQHHRRGMPQYELMQLIWPPSQYPKMWNYSSNGGPPICVMHFARAIKGSEFRAIGWPAKIYKNQEGE